LMKRGNSILADVCSRMRSFLSRGILPQLRDPQILRENLKQKDHRVAFAVGGAAAEPLARAGFPDMNRLQPLFPETRSR